MFLVSTLNQLSILNIQNISTLNVQPCSPWFIIISTKLNEVLLYIVTYVS